MDKELLDMLAPGDPPLLQCHKCKNLEAEYNDAAPHYLHFEGWFCNISYPRIDFETEECADFLRKDGEK